MPWKGSSAAKQTRLVTFSSGPIEHIVMISAAFLCSGLYTTLAEIFVPLRTLGLSFHKNMFEFKADTMYRKPHLLISHTCLNKVHSSTFQLMN